MQGHKYTSRNGNEVTTPEERPFLQQAFPVWSNTGLRVQSHSHTEDFHYLYIYMA